MLCLLSPSKTQDFKKKAPISTYTDVMFNDKIEYLIKILKKYDINDIKKIMKLSPKLAKDVYNIYKKYDEYYTDKNSKQCIYTYIGDAYIGFDINTLNNDKIEYLQNNILILSGLYGLLRPLDRIQEYRLDMNNNININLYEYWCEIITEKINDLIIKNNYYIIINLASNEYIKCINKSLINIPIINIEFKEYYDKKYKIISIYIKRARGSILRYIIDNNIKNIEDLKKYDNDGYSYNENLSNEDTICFTRLKP
eukprot:GHVL01014376.1.p1 GENE.GHVL01014376.1~~GHVL01014376.1.p1  ORF type:complete len:254 (+),score=100.62 GHVL01014376.1:940-1701(+)